MKFLICIFFAGSLTIQKLSAADTCVPGVQAGISPSVTAVCGSTWTIFNSSMPDNNTMFYDLYYLTSDGLNNKNGDVLYIHGGGENVIGDNVIGGLLPQFYEVVQAHLNMYIPQYSIIGYASLNQNITTATLSFNTLEAANTYWPLSASTPYDIRIDTEDMLVTGMSGSFPNEVLTVTRAIHGTQLNPHVTGAFIYTPTTVFPTQAKQVSCFQAFMGHNKGVNNFPGNPMDIRSWSDSAGTPQAMMNWLVGPQLIDSNACEYTVADYSKTNTSKVLLGVMAGDVGCLGHYSTQQPVIFHTACSWVGSSFTATFDGTTCTPTNPDAGYIYTMSQSGNFCLPGQTACAYTVPTSPITIPVHLIINDLDATVTTKPAEEFMSFLPSATAFHCPTCTHAPYSPAAKDNMVSFIVGYSPSSIYTGKIALTGQIQEH